MNQYKISVITSFYNVEKYVRSTISSVLDQTYKNFEFVVTDDYSTDRTKEILLDVIKETNDNRLRYVDIPSKKYAFWNPQKLASPDADLIVTNDADDILLPYALECINHYFTIFEPDVLGMTFSAMKYKEIFPVYDDQTAGLSDNFVEVPYFSKINSYLSGMIDISNENRNVFGTLISWKNIPIEFPEHSDTPWASSNDLQFLLKIEEYGNCINVPRVLKLVRQRENSENFIHWSKNGEIILLSESMERRKSLRQPIQHLTDISFDDISTPAEATYFSTLNFQKKATINFVGFDLTLEKIGYLQDLFCNHNVKIGFADFDMCDYNFVEVKKGTYVKDFIERYNYITSKSGSSEVVFFVDSRFWCFDIGHILEFIKTKTTDIVYESGDNRVAVVHNCKNLYNPTIQKPYKIKLVHTLCRPDDPREKASVACLSKLNDYYNIDYVQHVNPPYQGEIPEKRPSYNPVTPNHFGCYRSFQRAIKEEFTDDVDFLLFCECDCMLEVDHKTFVDTLYKTCDVIKQEKIDYFSFGDNTHAGTKELWSEVIRKIPNVDWMYITNKIALAHCLVFPKESRDKLIDMFDNYSHWGTTDNLLDYYFDKGTKAIIRKRMAYQHEGESVIDNVYKPKYDYPESINPVLSEATSGEISSGDTMLYNVLELYNEVKINPNRILTDDPKVEYNFIDGAFVELKGGDKNRKYEVSFYDNEKTVYNTQLKPYMWARPGIKYFKNWVLNVKGVDNNFEWTHKFDPTGKKIFITFESNALGDTIAWMPYVEEFRLKYNGQICVSTHWNKLFNKAYPEIEFVRPGTTVYNLYALFRIGCYENCDKNGKPVLNDNQSYGYSDTNRNPNGWRSVTLQKVATDILGLKYKEIRPRINEFPSYETNEKYITISEHSTMLAKQWNNLGGWNNIVEYLTSKGYKVLSLNNKESNTKGVISVHDKDITEIISILKGSKLHIGMGSGLSWLSWALQTPTIIIAGFSEKWSEPKVSGRVINENVCHGCYNDIYIPFDKSWLWCPRKKDYECTRAITSEMVISEIEKISF